MQLKSNPLNYGMIILKKEKMGKLYLKEGIPEV